MKCPDCNKEMEFGGIRIMDGMLNILNQVVWYPEAELDKFRKRNALELKLKADAYFCDECVKVVGIFEQR